MMYDFIIFETSVLLLLHENNNLAFSKIFTQRTVFKKPAYFGARNRRFRVEGRLKRDEGKVIQHVEGC